MGGKNLGLARRIIERAFNAQYPGQRLTAEALAEELAYHDVDPIAGVGLTTMRRGTHPKADKVAANFVLAIEHVVPGVAEQLLPHATYGTGSGLGRGLTPETLRGRLAQIPATCRSCALRSPVAVEPGRPMIRARGNVYVVFGTSGLDVRDALLKSSTAARERQVVKVEDYLLGGALAGATVKDALRLPFPVLSARWRDAVERAGGDAAALLAEGTDVFLTMHGILYGNDVDAYGYVSPVDLRALARAIRAARPHRVMTLMVLDDVWDTIARLSSGPHPLFTSSDPVTRAAAEVVNWRRQEFVVADHAARLLTRQPTAITFAMKHPLRTFERLLTRPSSEIVYVSHRIPGPKDVGEQREFRNFVAAVTREIRDSRAVTAVEAAALDEYRFVMDRDQIVDPQRDRWPVPEETLLACDLTPEQAEFAARPFDPRPDSPFPKAGNESEEAMMRLHDVLLESVNGRGRALAVQADGGVLGLRPFAHDRGERSFGMSIIARVNDDLRRLGEQRSRRPAVLYHPSNDETRRLLRACTEAVHAVLVAAHDVALVDGWDADAKPDLFASLVRRERAASAETSVLHTWADPRVAASTIGREVVKHVLRHTPAKSRRTSSSKQIVHQHTHELERLGDAVRAALRDVAGAVAKETSREEFPGAVWIDEDLDARSVAERMLLLRDDSVRAG